MEPGSSRSQNVQTAMRRRKNCLPPYYAYCVLRVEPEQEWEVCEGIECRPVFVVREGRLAMLLSRLESGFTPRPQSLVEHSRVIQHAFARHTVLPFRFGTAFESEPQARSVLIANRAGFQDSINRLRGKAEMHARLLFGGPQPPASALSPEQLCLLEMLHLARCRQVLKDILEARQGTASARPLPDGAWLVQLAHLVEEGRAGDYRRALTAAGQATDEFQVMVSGPWPPYHFLPAAIRVPPASEPYLYPGRRIGPASVAVSAALRASAAKA